MLVPQQRSRLGSRTFFAWKKTKHTPFSLYSVLLAVASGSSGSSNSSEPIISGDSSSEKYPGSVSFSSRLNYDDRGGDCRATTMLR